MHPQIMQDHRGHCPICGMNLVAYHGDGGADSGPALHVSSETQQKLGVRVVAAKRITIGRPIVTYGTVQPNENIVRDITPNTTGIIRKLYVTAVGDQVKVGQPLYQIFSQDLFMRQNDLIDNEDRRRQTLTSIRLTDEQNQRTLRAMQKNGSVLAARQKLNMRQANERNALMLETITREDTRLRDLLKYGGITDAMIKHVLKTRHAYDVWTVRATHPGYITSISVHPGSRVAPGTILFRTADLSKVWIDIALYPDQAPWVADGDAVSVSVPYTVRKPVSGKIIFISPLADGGTGIVHARVALDNADGRLRPGAFVDATIRARRHEALAIPRTALLRTGEGDMVMLALGDGHFLPTRVRTGLEDSDQVEVLSGLQPGAKVVVNGQFLLDAAAELSSAAQRMRTPAPAAHDGH
jgi:Cu(I)/Ag(I) efflux system membrane fusion protein